MVKVFVEDLEMHVLQDCVLSDYVLAELHSVARFEESEKNVPG